METPQFTHKGWFGLCPVYIAETYTECPHLEPRYPFTEWLLDISEFMFNVMGAMNPHDEGYFPIKITGEYTK